MSRQKLVVLAILVGIPAIFYFATRGPSPAKPNPPGTFSFAVLGDAPYFPWETLQYRVVLDELELNELGFVIHVGDMFWRPCSDKLYRRNLRRLDGLRHAVVVTPGDNEWSDCWEPGSGGYVPLERLARLREIFYADPTHSLGRNPIALDSQGADERFGEFVENARWQHSGLVFATVHLLGGWNGLVLFEGRTVEDDEAVVERTAAAEAWMRETFAVAKSSGATAVVLAFHANLALDRPANNRYRRTFEPFIEALEEEVEAFSGPVLIVQGDDHEYKVDHPLIRRTSGRRLENLTRMQVPGSPLVGWVRVTVTPGADDPFAFESLVVPHWKYW